MYYQSPILRFSSLIFVFASLLLSCRANVPVVREGENGQFLKKTATSVAITTEVNSSTSEDPTAFVEESLINTPNIDLSLTDFTHTAPSDILTEVTWFGGGGGDSAVIDCLQFDEPTINIEPSSHLEIWDEVFIETCGWQYQEAVSIVLEKPSGLIVQENYTASEDEWGVEYSHKIDLQDEIGEYRITFQGENHTLRTTFTIKLPPKPVVLYDGKMRLLIYGFSPNEKFRVLLYYKPQNVFTSTAQLLGWNAYQVDRYGNLLVSFEIEDIQAGNFVIIGDSTGEVRPKNSGHVIYEDTVLK